MDNSTPTLQIITRDQQRICIENLSNEHEEIIFTSSEGQISNQLLLSNDGRYLMIQEQKQKISTYDLKKLNNQPQATSNQLLVQSQNYQNVQNIYISDGNQFCLVLDKLSVDQFKLNILNFPYLELIESIEYKRYRKEQWPLVKFLNNDKYMVKLIQQSLYIMDTKTMQVKYTLDVGQSEYFSCQPHQDNFLVACYSLQKELSLQSTSGSLKIYSPSRSNLPIFERDVPDASEIQLKWSPNGQQLLMVKSSSQDTTNQSYFGQTYVYRYDFHKRDFIQIPTYEGPVHAVEWSPDSEQFLVISGFMPAGSVLFNKDGAPKFEFGKDHRNTIFWSPLKRFVLLCGFGNLDGSIDIWDTVQLKIVGRCKEKSTSLCTWSPCGRQFITCKITPRMNVDNQYKIFNYLGNILKQRQFDNSELYEVQFIPKQKGFFLDRPPSPKRFENQNNTNPIQQTNTEQQQKKLFVPVGGSGQLAQQLRMMKQTEGARVLDSNETFGNNTNTSNGWGLQRSNPVKHKQEELPPGCIQYEKKEKKKRIRHKKDDYNDYDEY